jgi:outer membrane lipoprotein-sorting protein
MRKTLYTVLTALLLLSLAPAAPAQGPKPAPAPKTDAKAEEVVRKAVEALGGADYLAVRTVVSRGYFSQYHEGRQMPPLTFTDYLSFPDRERTEFKGGGTRMVQTNTGETGWVYEGQAKKITDVTPAQAEDFRTAMRTSLDNVLRGWWRREGAALAYVGRREAGLAMRNEAVRLSYPDGFTVDFEFGARDFLPAKALYKKQNAEGDTVEEEDRYAQFLYIGTVRAPFVVDHYRAGTQSSRVNFDKVEFNTPIPDSLFAKPGDLKALLKSLK